METVSGELTDFCFVVAPNGEADAQASETVRRRFGFLAEETRMQIIAAIGQRVRSLVERGSGRPITVTISMEDGAINGAVTDRDEPHDGNGTEIPFEIPLPRLENDSPG
jgi:hypothetical protein